MKIKNKKIKKAPELPDESDRNTACGMPAQALTWLHDECCILVLHA